MDQVLGLFRDIIRWLLGKAVLVVLIVAALVLVSIFWSSMANSITSWISGAKKWPQEIARLEKRLLDVRNQLRKAQAALAFCESKDPPWYDLIERWKHDKCQRLRNRVEHLKDRRRRLETTLVWVRREPWRHVYVCRDALLTNLNRISLIVGLVLFGPPVWKVFMYHGLGRLATAGKPLRLSPGTMQGALIVSKPERNLTVQVGPRRSLSVRHAYIKHSNSHLEKRTRLFWRWSAPVLSYGAGLFQLTEVFVQRKSDGGTVVIGSDQPDSFVVELALDNHPGVVVHPRHIVGISGKVIPRVKWSLTNAHSWLTGQLRYYLFSGSGSIFVEAQGGIKASVAIPKVGVEERLVVGFDSRLEYSTKRTETFWPYLSGKVALMDDQFEGHSLFLTRVAGGGPSRNLVTGSLETVMTALGKFLGF